MCRELSQKTINIQSSHIYINTLGSPPFFILFLNLVWLTGERLLDSKSDLYSVQATFGIMQRNSWHIEAMTDRLQSGFVWWEQQGLLQSRSKRHQRSYSEKAAKSPNPLCLLKPFLLALPFPLHYKPTQKLEELLNVLVCIVTHVTTSMDDWKRSTVMRKAWRGLHMITWSTVPFLSQPPHRCWHLWQLLEEPCQVENCIALAGCIKFPSQQEVLWSPLSYSALRWPSDAMRMDGLMLCAFCRDAETVTDLILSQNQTVNSSNGASHKSSWVKNWHAMEEILFHLRSGRRPVHLENSETTACSTCAASTTETKAVQNSRRSAFLPPFSSYLTLQKKQQVPSC